MIEAQTYKHRAICKHTCCHSTTVSICWDLVSDHMIISFHIILVEGFMRGCVCVENGRRPHSFHCCPVAYPPSSHTCRGMRPSRGVPRGCLPGLDIVSLSADVFLCLRSQSPCPRSPCPRSPRQWPRHRPQRHWPALMLSGKLSLAWPGITWPSLTPEKPSAAVFAHWSSPAPCLKHHAGL